MTSRGTTGLILMSMALAMPAWAQNGAVSGRVTSAATGAPMPGVEVRLCRRQYGATTCLAPALTNASGVYVLSAPPDTYYAYTHNSAEHVDEIFDNLPCVFGCNESSAVERGVPIVVSAGAPVPGRDFALDPGGILTGIVRDAAGGVPLAGVGISIEAGGGGIGPSVSTDSSGRYVIRGLATASYSLKTSNRIGYTNEVYDNFLCPYHCWYDLGGTPIAVTAGVITGDKDFALDRGGRISGTVTDAQTSAPVTGGSVYAVGESDAFIGFFPISDAGVYTVTGLPAGRYFLVTMTDHADEMFDNLPWPGRLYPFDLNRRGTPITVSLGGTTTANFALEPAGSVSGRITRADTGAPVEGYCVTLFAPLEDQLIESGQGCSDAFGAYAIDGLHASSYFAVTGKHGDLIAELYDNIPCPGWSCAIASGTPIVVRAGTTTSGTDFVLDLGGYITGTISDASTGAPLEGEVFVFHRVGDTAVQVGWQEEESSYTVRGLPTGTYYAFGRYDFAYLDEAFDDIPCAGGRCSPEQMAAIGTAIDVTAGGVAGGVHFALQPRVFSDPPVAPTDLLARVDGYTVVLRWRPGSGGTAPTTYVLEAGLSPGTTMVSLSFPATWSYDYRVPGVGPGRYYVRIKGRNDFGTGPPSTEIEVIVNADGSGRLEPPQGLSAWMSGRRLTLTWSPPESGGMPTAYIVEAGTAAGWRNIGSIVTTARAFTYEGVPDGFYFLRVRSARGVATSRPSLEIMLNAGGVPAPPGPPSGLAFTVSGSTVGLNWTAPTGAAPTGYVLEAGSAEGLSDLVVIHTGSTTPAIAFTGVLRGRYYVRVKAVNALGASVPSNEVVVTVH